MNCKTSIQFTPDFCLYAVFGISVGVVGINMYVFVRISGGKFIGQKYSNNELNKGKANRKTTESYQRKTSGAEKLHPSWEASKKKKEQLSTITSFQGKKITFDD